MQKGAARAVDRPDRLQIEIDEIVGNRSCVFRIGAGEPSPPSPDSDDLVPVLGDPIDHALDACVETGYITASGQNANPHVILPSPTAQTVSAPEEE